MGAAREVPAEGVGFSNSGVPSEKGAFSNGTSVLRHYTLVEAIPETGRTHQIRAHLYALGIFIAADALYGDGNPIFLSQLRPDFPVSALLETPLLARLGLHARSLAFNHPVNGEALVIEATYPQDLEATLQQLRTFSPKVALIKRM